PRVLSTEPSAKLLPPIAGLTFSSTSATFTWAQGGGVSKFNLRIGSAQDGSDLYLSPDISGATFLQLVDNLPCDGRNLFVRLDTTLTTNVTNSNYAGYKACTSAGAPTNPSPADFAT